MESVIFVAIIAVATTLILGFFIRVCPELFAFLYCTGAGILLALVLLSDNSDLGNHASIALGCGVGALIGLVYSFIFHQDRHNIPFGLLLSLLIGAPIVILILGFIVFLFLGFIAAFMFGGGENVMTGSALILGLLGAIFGGGGTLYIIIVKR